MKKIETADGEEIAVYEDHQSGDTFNEFEENQSREEYYETVMDYLRSPEHRIKEDDPDKPEVVENIEQLWEESNLESWDEQPQNREEREQKLDLFWKIGKAIAKFYESVGRKRKQCPQCGYYSLEKAEECGSNAQKYEGCGEEFDHVRNRGYNTQNKLEKGLGSINPEAESTTKEMIEKWGNEPEIEGMPSWSFLTDFKKFYWIFPDGEYSPELSLSHHYALTSYYNARVIVLPVYWDLVERAKNNDDVADVEEWRQNLSDAVEEYEEQPRRNFLMNDKYRQYREK